MANLLFLELEGDARERGVTQGRATAPMIRNNLETYFARFASSGSSRDEVLKEAEAWSEVIAGCDPEYREEMSGVAEGADLSLTEVAVLNARYEITYCLYAKDARAAASAIEQPLQEGCTLFGLLPEVTADGSCIVGQNWDWLEGLRGNVFVKRVRRGGAPGDGKPDFVGFTEAGIVGAKMGVNSAGIGLCLAGLLTAQEGMGDRHMPIHVRCAQILDAWRFSEALRPVLATDRTCSANFMIGHADGEIINIEATNENLAYLYPEDGVVTHGNHLLAEKRVASVFERIAPSTVFRPHRLRRLLTRNSGRLDLTHIHAALSDQFSYPSSICLFPDPALPAARRNATIASIAVDLTNRVLHVTDGQPSQSPFQSFALDAAPQSQNGGMSVAAS